MARVNLPFVLCLLMAVSLIPASYGLKCLHCIGPQCDKIGNRFFTDCGLNGGRDDEAWRHQCVTVFHRNYEKDEILFKGCSTDVGMDDGCRYIPDPHQLVLFHPILKGIPGATACLCSNDYCNARLSQRPKPPQPQN